jgi:hypothetical protein
MQGANGRLDQRYSWANLSSGGFPTPPSATSTKKSFPQDVHAILSDSAIIWLILKNLTVTSVPRVSGLPLF